MAVRSYGDKRREHKATWRSTARRREMAETIELGQAVGTHLVAVGTIAGGGKASGRCALSVLIEGRYEIRVGPGFEPETLMGLVRALEQLSC